ncbi:PaaI family thioesterase [Pseudemcibacter aquimaris]|uniref:PaaI family thioesterase n=1 Tax=Pseudemcibacter aquimaris TaxID=2857064 RepID=UPI002012F5FC|nr:PaaI family thioesterase [Pseudemcibacter aquimaris]MCC3861979.1 PaaI family thioesterase [Pseudemcibacter aquimaris]WDU58731.1 PaaI family thioesterase [Pseudemcibacter aquimaris]
MNGIDRLKGMMAGDIPPPTMAKTMSTKLVGVDDGFVRFIVTADDRLLNLMGGVHGGFSATVMDTVTGCAVSTLLDENTGFATTDLNVKMVRPIQVGQELIAEGRVINKSRRLAIADGKIIDENGKIYATGSASCMILSKDC